MVLGDFGTDYGTRAVVALFGLGANLPQDAVYPSAFVDGAGQPLDGANRYVIHFDKDATPPVQAFWSITMYDANFVLRRQPDQPLCAQQLDAIEEERGRLARPVRAGRIAGQGQGVELAARGVGAVQPDASHVLADRDAAVDHGRLVEAAGSHEGAVRLASVKRQ